MRFSKTGFVSIIAFMIFTGTANIINIIDPAIWSKEPITSKIDNNTVSHPIILKIQGITTTSN